MIQVDITRAIREVTRGFSNLTKQQINGAVSRAMNHTIAIGRTESSRQIRQIYKIKTKYLGAKPKKDADTRNSALAVKPSTTNTLQAAIRATGRPLPLIAFPARKSKAGITIQIKAGTTKVLPGAFFATMKSGHRGIFARGAYAGGKFASRRSRRAPTGEPDLKITELSTASVPHAFLNKTAMEATATVIKNRFPNRFEHEIKRLFK